MAYSVKITTPIPSVEEFGDRLGLSKARQRSLAFIVNGIANGALVTERNNGHAISTLRTVKRNGIPSNASRGRKNKRAGVVI
jgi:hypothetical protein